MDWHKIDADLRKFEDSLDIPDSELTQVDYIDLKTKNDLSKIPNGGGCYWIWTTEKILHSFHNKKKFPCQFNNGEIIYNGIAKDNVRGRIEKHLFGKIDEGMSAISIDILTYNYQGSHRKKAMAGKGNTAFFEGKRIRNKENLLKLNLSNTAKEFIENSDCAIHFRNGINIMENKHKDYLFRVYFICNLKSYSYGDIIEKKWREKYELLPRLCTYSKGR